MELDVQQQIVKIHVSNCGACFMMDFRHDEVYVLEKE